MKLSTATITPDAGAFGSVVDELFLQSFFDEKAFFKRSAFHRRLAWPISGRFDGTPFACKFVSTWGSP